MAVPGISPAKGESVQIRAPFEQPGGKIWCMTRVVDMGPDFWQIAHVKINFAPYPFSTSI